MNGRLLVWSHALMRGGPAARAFVPYLVPAGVVGAALARVRGARAGQAAGLAVAGLVAAKLAPRLVASAQPALAEPLELTVMSANVLKGRADPEALVALVRAHRPDVLALQEQHPRYLRRLQRAGLDELLPHRVAGSGRRTNDAAILSRHPLEPFAPGLPGVFSAAHLMLGDGRRVPFTSVHPLAPVGAHREQRWRQALAELPAPAGPLAGGVLAGDFNATLDHPEFRALLEQGWRDAALERGAALVPTWRGPGRLAVLTIDHVLVPPAARVVDYRVEDLPGSDHRVITVRLQLPAR